MPGNSSTSSAARTYSPDPPTRMARFPPREWMSWMAARHSFWKSATLASCVTSMVSNKWCGTPPALFHCDLGSSNIHATVELQGVGVDHLAVQGQSEVDARSDLPEPVGPTTAMTGWWGFRTGKRHAVSAHGPRRGEPARPACPTPRPSCLTPILQPGRRTNQPASDPRHRLHGSGAKGNPLLLPGQPQGGRLRPR